MNEQLTPNAVAKVGGYFTFEAIRDGKTLWVEKSDNIVCNEGLDYLLNVAVDGATQKLSWYVGLFSGNYTPIDSVTAATIAAAATETMAYTEASRITYTPATSVAQSLTNTASKATFSINANSTALYGGFLVTESLKGGVNVGGTDKLMAASRFGTAKTLDAGDQLLVTYTLGATST